MAEMKVLSHEADSLAGDLHAHVSGKKQQYTRLVRKILSEVQQMQESTGGKQKLDLTVATYALFGMMNWIYNWYDPHGKLSVGEVVDNITHLFLNGFLVRATTDAQGFAPKTAKVEHLSVWRAS
jgi:hypothetical protein